MNRNTESHFAELPNALIERSMFDRSAGHKTSFNVGELIPFFIDEVLPGDTFQISTSAVVRLQTLITPIMDNMYMDTYYYFVPNRISWNHWKEFCGENTESAWVPTTEYELPYITTPEGGFAVGSIADYFGVPTGVYHSNVKLNALPFRDYALICDQWYRDQNVSDPLNIPLGDETVVGSNGDNYITDVAKGGKPFKVAKYHDYFTSCLPSPQKGPSVSIFGQEISKVDNSVYSLSDFRRLVPVFPEQMTSNPFVEAGKRWPLRVAASNGTAEYDLNTTSMNNQQVFIRAGQTQDHFTATNLWANVGAMDLSINELRLAFQLQKFYEKNARAGTRYREVLKEHFGVNSPDARMMIPEYLGGHRFPLSIHQVANQSQGETDFLGDLGAMSNTSDVHDDFVKSFVEHGFIIGVCCVRYDHSYPQGLERFWSRRDKLDYYWPVFANIGEQPVYNQEIFLSSEGSDTADSNELVFGYQEAWADYRYKPSRVSGEMRPGIDNSLASWHLADYYDTKPSLSDSWIREDKSNVDRVLTVQSSLSNQVFCDFYIKNICTRPMPMYSIPGLIDHH